VMKMYKAGELFRTIANHLQRSTGGVDIRITRLKKKEREQKSGLENEASKSKISKSIAKG